MIFEYRSFDYEHFIRLNMFKQIVTTYDSQANTNNTFGQGLTVPQGFDFNQESRLGYDLNIEFTLLFFLQQKFFYHISHKNAENCN